MTADRIEELISLLPRNAPYVNNIPRALNKGMGVPEEVDIYAYAMNDPAFGWMFVNSFLDLGFPVPALVYESTLLRPYCYVRYGNYDRNARVALEMQHLHNRSKRALLKCMLLVDDMSYEQIAKTLFLPVDSVHIYEALFWNVRDRMEDKAYLNHVVYPDTRKIELQSTYITDEDPQSIVLRITLQHGMKVVEEFMGIRNPIQEFDSQNEAKSYESRVLSAGNFMAKVGFLHQHQAYAVSSARHVLQSIKMGGDEHVDDDARRGLEGMSLGRSLTDTFMEITRSDVERQLKLQYQSLS